MPTTQRQSLRDNSSMRYHCGIKSSYRPKSLQTENTGRLQGSVT